MKKATVIFGSSVDAAIRDMIDYVELDSIPTVIRFLERVQQRLVGTLSTFPESGSPFQGSVRLFVVEGYSFLYEYHPERNEVHVLEMKAPGIDWR
ncbi:type II toxin-antitoxin system RelE/ParE family toxin [Pararhodobacter sp. CCB-MM2]|uniref:type II toxin-antitoxin system RelE/ParE family toxin n=1 Tax=Pararhodobacter sp. CCB-MM2 TaxID=1786003 RepID=UPI000830EAA4|nr:type II toxin-antitoxin system RelE/ParE family toxin [Pararhodobacter sp. CCB-MM2]